MSTPSLCNFLVRLATDSGVLDGFKSHTGTGCNYNDFATWLATYIPNDDASYDVVFDHLYNWDAQSIIADAVDELNRTASGGNGYAGGSTLSLVLPMDHLQRQRLAEPQHHLQHLSDTKNRRSGERK